MKAQMLLALLAVCVTAGASQAQSEHPWGSDPGLSVEPLFSVHKIAERIEYLVEEAPGYQVLFDDRWVQVDSSKNPPTLKFSSGGCGGDDAKSYEVPFYLLSDNPALSPDRATPVFAITATDGSAIAFAEDYWDDRWGNDGFLGLSGAAEIGTLIHEMAHVAFEQNVEEDDARKQCQSCIQNPPETHEDPKSAPCSEAYANGMEAADLCDLANSSGSVPGDFFFGGDMRQDLADLANARNEKCETENAKCAKLSGQDACNCSLSQPCPQQEGCPGPCALEG